MNSQTESNPLAGSDTPWLSVIMPTYNGEKFVAAALNSACGQAAREEMEILVIDDGSSDRTPEIVNSFSAQLNIRLIKNTPQKNWVKNTNRALQEARGRYISLLHQDDLWLPGRIARLKQLSAEHPEAVLLLHPSQFVDPAGKKIGMWNCPFPKSNRLLDSQYVFRRLIVQNFIAIPAPLFKRETAATIGPMNEALWFTADWDYWLRFAQAGPWAYCPAPLACFRIHPQSQTMQGSRDARDYRGQYTQILDKYLPQLDDDDRLRQVAQFSSDLNCRLAESFHGRRLRVGKLALEAAKLGPIGCYQYFAFSRIVERVVPRLRSSVRSPESSTGAAL